MTCHRRSGGILRSHVRDRAVRVATALLASIVLLVRSATGHAPHDVVAAVGVSPSYATDGTVIAAVQLSDHRFLARSTDRGKSWTEVSGELLEVHVGALEISPALAVDGTVFAGTRKGGVHKSTDGGLTFAPSNVGFRGETVQALALSQDFANDATLFAASDAALNRSTNGGASWTDVTVGLPSKLVAVVAFAGSPQVVYAGSKELFRSLDGGQTWSLVATFPSVPVSLAVSPAFATDQTLAVSFGSAGPGVRVSTDGGASWSAMDAGLTDLAVNDVAIAADGTMFAVTKTAACFRASAAGGAWSLHAGGFEALSDMTATHYYGVVPSPSYAIDGEVFVSAYEGLFRSADGGLTWGGCDLYHQRLFRVLEPSPDYAADGLVFLGNYGGGPFRIHSPSDTWAAAGYGVESLWSGTLEISPAFAADGTLFYGYDGTWRSTNRGHSWTKVWESPAITRSFGISPNFATDGEVIMNVCLDGTFRSTDHGVHWAPLPSLPAKRILQIRMSPAYPADPTVFASPVNSGLLRSDDAAASFQDVSGPMSGGTVRAFALSPSFAADGVVFAGAIGKGLFRSNDRGQSWTAVTGLPGGAADTIESIAISPAFAVAPTLFVVSAYHGLFASLDGGASWRTRNLGLPVDAKRVVRLSPAFATDQTVFVTTHDWAYRSTDAGVTWQVLPGFVRVDDSHPMVVKTGSWPTYPFPKAYGGRVSWSSAAGDEQRAELFGSHLEFHAWRDSESGIAELYLDGALAATIDLYAAATIPSGVVWSSTYATSEWREVRVRVTGQKNALSAGSKVKVDGFLRRF